MHISVSASFPAANFPHPKSVAKDRSWFGDDYQTISSFLHGPRQDQRAPVIGIGTVILPVKVSPDATNRDRSEVKLYNVLHAPDSICNIIGTPVFWHYHVSLQPGLDYAGTITLKDDTPVGYFRLPALNIYELRLTGHPIGPRVGPSPFEPDNRILVIAKWPRWERDKWAARLPAIKDVSLAADTPDADKTAFWDRCTIDERQWLRKNYGNEHKYMGNMRLNINVGKDREEGLRLMRALIEKEESTGGGESTSSPRQPEPTSDDRGLRIIGNATADAGLGGTEKTNGDKGFKITRIPDAEPNRVVNAPTGPRQQTLHPNAKGYQNPQNHRADNQPKAPTKPAKNKGQQEPASGGKGNQAALNPRAQAAANGAGKPAKNNQQQQGPASGGKGSQAARPVMAETAANAVAPAALQSASPQELESALEAEKKRLAEAKRLWLQARRTNSEAPVTRTAASPVEAAPVQSTPRANGLAPVAQAISPSNAPASAVQETPRVNGLAPTIEEGHSSEGVPVQDAPPRTNSLARTDRDVNPAEAAAVRDTPRTNGLALTRYRFVEDDDENELTAFAKFRVNHLTMDEFAWMNDHHGGTQAFMSKMGLKVTRHADREKAQQIITILMGE
ncbi:hypothetical protein PWT90_00660 [Aphanocladium album]|nr:hypothetical protein PWT90_00660 [Aphanocladium album]